jgi:hypothetical protein
MTIRPADALLLIACSKRKAPGPKRGRAWDMYDGRLFQVLKKALRDCPGWEQRLDVRIVSARYGLLRPTEVIEAYDERLTAELARERGALWAEQLRQGVTGRNYRSVHVNLGRDYLCALPNLGELFAGAGIEWATGGIGTRNAQTRFWVLRRLRPRAGCPEGGR